MSNQLQIGTAKHVSDGGFTKRNNFYLDDKNGGNNVYRVLPPMHSLAAKGQYAKYWSVYQGFVDSSGKKRWFASVEEYDPRTKTLKVSDPLAEKLKENRAKQETMKQAGATEEQLDGFYETHIKPFSPSKRYYVNAINQNGEIGVLALPATANTALRALANEYSGRGVDITGIKGLFLNFKRVKGARPVDVSYSVEVYRESIMHEGEMLEKAKVHTLTEDIINRLANEAEDLSELFTIPKREDLQMLAAADVSQRGLVVDRIVNKSSAVEQATKPQMQVNIPGTAAIAVPRVESSASGLNVVLPELELAKAAAQMPTGVSAPAASPVKATLSDDELNNIFGN